MIPIWRVVQAPSAISAGSGDYLAVGLDSLWVLIFKLNDNGPPYQLVIAGLVTD